MSSRRCTLVGCSLRRADTTMSDYGTSAHTCNDLILSLLWTLCSKPTAFKNKKEKRRREDRCGSPSGWQVVHHRHDEDVENTSEWNVEKCHVKMQKSTNRWLHGTLSERKITRTKTWFVQVMKNWKLSSVNCSKKWMTRWVTSNGSGEMYSRIA